MRLPISIGKFAGIPLNFHPGAFGFQRRVNWHPGVDLYTTDGQIVKSIEDGVVVGVPPGERDADHQWRLTNEKV